MSSLPPHLLYLIIYNPTLRPPVTANPDDEDAQEQAHVLFYTANHHAVSKDRVLRQVGLAKALANFTTIFDTRAPCESVHSQSRRMIMLSPEPDFWIHACFELEKVPRVSKKEEKGKAKQKEPIYDYNDASLHDAALRTQLLTGYEAFKLIHGSFTSILNCLSKEALELQLERFFTVWAWSWDLHKQISFADYLGVRVHPLSTQLMPLIDVFEDKLPPHYFPIVLISSCIVASKSTPLQCPPALIRHLLRVLEARQRPPSRRPETLAKAAEGDSTPEDAQPSASPPSSSGEQKHARTVSRTFLGVPTLNMNVNVDVKKWLTFGLASSSSGTSSGATKSEEAVNADDNGTAQQQAQLEKTGPEGNESERAPESSQEQSNQEPPVDAQALEDALSSETASQLSRNTEDKKVDLTEVPSDSRNHLISSKHEPIKSGSAVCNINTVPNPQDPPSTETAVSDHHSTTIPDQPSPLSSLPPSPSPSFSELRVYLPCSDADPQDTHRRLIRYLYTDNILLALVPTPTRSDDALDEAVCQDSAERSAELIDRLKEIVDVEQEKIASAFSSSPVQNVLQKSQHVISTSNQLTYSSLSFSSTSWHLHDGKKALALYPNMQEIYSRGQSPQDWHLVKRGGTGVGIGIGTNGQEVKSESDVYMEIGRKEASLVDVDTEITGVLRRFTE